MVVVGMVVRLRTGAVGSPSTADFAVIATAAFAGPRLDGGVLDRLAEFLFRRQIRTSPVSKEGRGIGYLHTGNDISGLLAGFIA